MDDLIACGVRSMPSPDAPSRSEPMITLHDPEHALKEIDAAAAATCREPAQVVQILRYGLAYR